MESIAMLTRRAAIMLSVAAATCAPAVRAAAAPGFGRKRYDSAMVIDAMGAPGGDDPSQPDDGKLTARQLADVRTSGVTAANVTVNQVGNGPDLFEKAVGGIAGMDYEINAHPDIFIKVLKGSDLTTAKNTHRMGIILGFQDCAVMGNDLTRLATFYDLGVRIAQPTYNIRNLLGDGCLEEADGGLSRLGHQLIDEINRLGMLLDMSHAGPRTIAEGIAASKAPMAITHTGCRALNDHPRNTSDSSLKALADRGGVAGIYFMPYLRSSGQPHSEDVIRHLEHAVSVCGEDHVGLGTDGGISGVAITDELRKMQAKIVAERAKAGIGAPGESGDVFNLIPEYNEPRRFETLANDLSQRGWTSGRIDKILGANFARLFTETWKG